MMIRPYSFRFSAHALCRMQQRSIQEEIVELLLDFGSARPARGKAVSYRFDAESWAAVVEILGSAAKRFDKFRSIYAIVSDDGVVITVSRLH